MLLQILALPPTDEKRVITFSLYGPDPVYAVGVIHNIDAAKMFYPGR